MCCFSRPIKHVAQTQIFARSAPQGEQFLVYKMSVKLDEELAMILPLPVPPGSTEDAARFIDLSRYDAFFSDLSRGFPEAVLGAKSRDDGKIHIDAEFDHALYCQPDPSWAELCEWECSLAPLHRFADCERAAGILDGQAPCRRYLLHGTGRNRDVILHEDELRARVLCGE